MRMCFPSEANVNKHACDTLGTKMSGKAFHLRWNNHLQNLRSLFEELFAKQSFVDVTISCQGGTIKAHKIILSACSPYFENIFQENPCKHPVIILKEVPLREMQVLLEYMYKGEIDVLEDELDSLICTAGELEIRGLVNGFSRKGKRNADGENSEKHEEEDIEVPKSDCEPQSKKKKLESKTDCQPDVDDKCSLGSNECREISEQNDSHIQTSNGDKVEGEHEESESSSHVEKSEETASEIYDQETTPVQTQTYVHETRYKGQKRVDVGLLRPSTKRHVKKIKEMKVSTLDQNKNNTKVTAVSEESKGNNAPLDNSEVDNNAALFSLPIKQENPDFDFYSAAYAAAGYSAFDHHFLKGEEGEEVFDRNSLAVCVFCFKDFKNTVELRKHLRSHTGEKPYHCDFCSLRFTRAAHLKRHRRVHTGERPYPCAKCGKCFSRQDKLKQHLNRHEMQEELGLPPPLVKGESHSNGIMCPPSSFSEHASSSLVPSMSPFGDMSYLSSLSLANRYSHPTASTSGLNIDDGQSTEELLSSVRKLGECTIQAFPSS